MTNDDDYVSAYLNMLKDRLGLTSDAELATELGFGKSTFATWRRRKEIPSPALIRIADKVGHDLTTGDEVLYALGVSQTAMLVRALYNLTVVTHRDNIDRSHWPEDHDLMWWAGVRIYIERFLIPIIREKMRETVRPAPVYEDIAAAIKNGEYLTPDHILKMIEEDQK